jgi:hypothetical protein
MRNADNIRLTPPPQERGRLVRAKPCPEHAGGPPALRSLPIPVQWHDRAWRPRITCGAPVSDPARWSSAFGLSENVFQHDFLREFCAGPEAGAPMTGPSRGGLLLERRRIQFPTL